MDNIFTKYCEWLGWLDCKSRPLLFDQFIVINQKPISWWASSCFTPLKLCTEPIKDSKHLQSIVYNIVITFALKRKNYYIVWAILGQKIFFQ